MIFDGHPLCLAPVNILTISASISLREGKKSMFIQNGREAMVASKLTRSVRFRGANKQNGCNGANGSTSRFDGYSPHLPNFPHPHITWVISLSSPWSLMEFDGV